MSDTIGTPENSPDGVVHDIDGTELVEHLVNRWILAGQRTFCAQCGGTAPDYWTELALGARIARDVTRGSGS